MAVNVFDSDSLNIELTKLKSDIKLCDKCSLYKFIDTPYWDEIGSPNSDVVIVGESPSDKSLEYLGRCLRSIGLDRSKVFLTNVCMCKACDIVGTRKKERSPSDVEIQVCSAYLFKQIELINPKIIITLGRIPTSTVLNNKISFTSIKANLLDFCFNSNIKVFPIWHPSYIVSYGDSDVISQNWKDWLYLKSILKQMEIL